MRDPKAIRKAIMTAKSVARLIDPHFGRVPLPEIGDFGRQKSFEEHSPMIHAVYGEPLPDHFAVGGDVEPYQDPETSHISEWNWRPLEDVRSDLGYMREIPSHVLKFGDFMDEIAQRAGGQGLTPRDLIKAYTITRSSIQRRAAKTDKVRQAGLPLDDFHDEMIRPEGAFGEWLHTAAGQAYLDAAEKGQVHHGAIQDAVRVMAPFGKHEKDIPDALSWAATHLPGNEKRVSELIHAGRLKASHPSEWRDFTSGIRGIGPSKSGFYASLLGRGDQPTLDARQIILHTGRPTKEATRFLSRKGGAGGVEAVNRLTARQEAMGLGIPERLSPYYQHLAHHAVWDQAGGDETTHEDVMRSMRHAASGGAIMPHEHWVGEILHRLDNSSAEHYADGGEVEYSRAAFLEGNHPLVPQVVYHGTDRNITQFESHHPRRVDAGGGDTTDTGWYGKGHYFTPSPEAASNFASNYAVTGDHGPNVMPVHLSMKNPFIVKVPRSSSGATEMDRALDRAGAPQSSDERLISKGRGERLPSEQTKILREMGHDGVIVMHQFGHSDEKAAKRAEERAHTAERLHQEAADEYYDAFGDHANPDRLEAAKEAFVRTRRAAAQAREEAGGEYRPAEFVAFEPHQVKSASGNRGTFDPSNPDIRYADGGEVDDQHPYAAPNDLGLYSHAAVTAAGLPQERGTPEQFRGMLLNRGVKPTEMQWGEYDYAFGDKPEVTRDEVAKHFWVTTPGQIEEVKLHKNRGANRTPYHEEYTIPGGKDYREVLLKHHDEGQFEGNPHHFGGEGDILTSLRLKDRQDAEGKKLLHLEELQSDWAQQGRKGFKGTESRAAEQALDDYLKDLQSRTGMDVQSIWPHAAREAAQSVDEDNTLLRLIGDAHAERQNNKSRPPEAPYVTRTNDWVDLGLKRALMEAAREGHDKLVWTPGDEQADRYDLSKHIREIRHEKNDDGTYNLDVMGHDGDRVYDREDIEAEELPGLVGKEMADKIMSGHGEKDEHPGYRDWRTLSGLDLKVGGEGMRKFYDELLPKRLMRLAKMHDPEAQFSHAVIRHPDQHYHPDEWEEGGYMPNPQHTSLPALEITPKMRESILKRGFPAFADGGKVEEHAEAYADGGDIDPELFKQYMKRIHSPLSEDSESVRKALQIAGSYRAPTGMETGVGSLYGIKQSMPASAVTRTIKDIPGVKLKPQKKGSWEDFYDLAKGNEFVNVGGDLSGFGRLTHINGKELAWPVDLHAGADYMREPNPGRVWANIGAHATGFQTKIREANERGKELYGILSPMGPSAVNSSHNMFDTLMAQIPNAEIDPEHLKEFDEAIKRGDHLNPKIKRNPKLFASYLNKLEKWPGLENAKDVSEFGRPWKGNLTGAHRSDIVKFMDKSYWRDRGFPEVGVTRAAITNPDLLGAGGNKLGYRVVKLAASQPQGGKSIFKHSTYPVDTFGEYMMDVPLVQRHYAQPDVIERLIRTPTKAGQVVHPYSEDPMGRSTARKLFEEQKQIQPINQRFIDSVMTGIENQEKYGLKKGGSVRKALMIAKTTKKK